MVEINPTLLKNIEEYCKVNSIEDINEEINKILQKGFNIIRYGASPFERRDMEKNLPTKITEVKEEIKTVSIEAKEIPPIEILTKEENKTEETPIVEEKKPKRKYTRKVRIIKNE